MTPAMVKGRGALDTQRLLRHLRVLADDDQMEGRGSDTNGIMRARAYQRARLADIGLEPLFPGFEQHFVFEGTDGKRTQGVNLIGLLRGRLHPEIHIILSAHYDHLGQDDASREGTYTGADDNASGVAALLEIARSFADTRPDCTLVVCLFDGEEAGLKGSEAFIARAPIPLDSIAVEINVDMNGRADEGLLWAVGGRHHPWLAPHVDAIAAVVRAPLVAGHDRFSIKPGENWTKASDHASFHAAGIPWLHFGVSNHDDTHKAEDELEQIDTEFLHAAAEAVHIAVAHFDARGPELLGERANR
jgi:Zn-dependent M28 family amino/carboxypeptidase